MDKDLKKGTRIYYGGDMANDEGFGVIKERATDQFGTWVDVEMDDGRDFNKLPITIFSDEYLGHGGTRFVTEKAYRAFRQAQIAKVEATLKERGQTFADYERIPPEELDAPAPIKRQMYDVWKDETSYGGRKWKLLLKGGINSFKTKTAATASAGMWKEVDARAEAQATAARVAAPTNTGMTSQILYRDDFRGDKMYVWEGLCESACLQPSMVKELTIYIKVPKEITKEEYDGKAPAKKTKTTKTTSARSFFRGVPGRGVDY